MRTRRRMVACSLLLLAACAARVRADKTAVARKAIEANYARYDAALLKGDMRTILSMTDPDAMPESYKRLSPAEKQKIRERMTAAFAQGKVTRVSTTVRKVTLNGNQATVECAHHGEMVMYPNTPKAEVTVMDSVIRQVWRKKGNTWLIAGSPVTLSQNQRSGKPGHK